MSTTETRSAIIEAAETLFARNGFGAVGLREIARLAGVNASSVNYHFGSKLGCLEAIYARHTTPMNMRRKELMGEAMRIADPDERVRALLRGYLLPAFTALDDETCGPRFTRLRAILSAEGNEEARTVIARTFDETNILLIDGLAESLPGASRDAIVWRSQFLLGALYYTLINPERIVRLSGGSADGHDHVRAIDEIVQASFASLKALVPAAKPPNKQP